MQEMAFSVTLPIFKNTVRDIVQRIPWQHPFNVHFFQHPFKSWMNIDWARLVVKVVNFQCSIQLYKQLWKGHDFSILIFILLFNTNIKWVINLIKY